MNLPFQEKICGLTQVENAVAIAQLGVSAIGLNFSRHSARQVDVATAAKIADAFTNAVKARDPNETPVVVGVFVEHSVQQASEIAEQVGLDLIQLHGDHSVDDIQAAGRPVIWVLRIKTDSSDQLITTISENLEAIRNLGVLKTESSSDSPGNIAPSNGDRMRPGQLAAVLLDAHVEGQWGGTGEKLAWEPLGRRHQWKELGFAAWPKGLPLILAGGINPANVRTALREARPDAVDIASGVESSAGVKDLERVRQLLLAANNS